MESLSRILLLGALMLAGGIVEARVVPEHTCVVEDGKALCWGAGESGQLGSAPVDRGDPAFVPGLGAVTSVAVGNQHACAVAGGIVNCWGANDAGQLGRAGSNSFPAPVAGLPGPATVVVAGARHTCALLQSGAVYCWGSDTDGQVGNASSGGSTPNPVPLGGLQVTALASGANHVCAAGPTQVGISLQCWGDNVYGQVNATAPAKVGLPVVAGFFQGSSLVGLGLGHFHSCIALGSGTSCWGSNARGQLGDGTSTDRAAPAPTQIGLVQKVVGGFAHGCALTAGQEVRCWGANDLGQLANGTFLDATSPAAIDGTTGAATDLAAFGDHTCARYITGWMCWGSDRRGALGTGDESDSLVPSVAIEANAGTPVQVAAAANASVDGGSRHTCLVDGNGAVACWGSSRRLQLALGPTAQFDVPAVSLNFTISVPAVAEVALADDATCLRTTTSTVNCFGANESGQLADGTFDDDDGPFNTIPGFGSVNALAAGARHACASRGATGTTWCWGSDGYGQIGNGLPNVPEAAPVAVSLPPAIDIGAGEDHSCALFDTSLRCWGDNLFGQLGDGTFASRSAPEPYTEVFGLSNANVKQFVVGKLHNCVAMKAPANGLRCWGYNENGELGIPASLRVPTPVDVPALAGKSVDGLALGGFHTCVIVDGGVQCWGLNEHGQLGDGTRTARSTPAWVSGLGAGSGVTAIGAGDEHTCAILGDSDSSLRCWGNRLNGRLGDGKLGYRTVATPVANVPGADTLLCDGFEDAGAACPMAY